MLVMAVDVYGSYRTIFFDLMFVFHIYLLSSTDSYNDCDFNAEYCMLLNPLCCCITFILGKYCDMNVGGISFILVTS